MTRARGLLPSAFLVVVACAPAARGLDRFAAVADDGGADAPGYAPPQCNKARFRSPTKDEEDAGIPTPAPICSANQGSASEAASLAASDEAFAANLSLPAMTAVGAGQNAVLSPYGLSAVLQMVDVGAQGATDSQMQSVLSLSAGAANLAPAYAALACEDETDGNAAGDTLEIANAVWGQTGVAWEASFTSTLSSGYGAALQQADFADDPTAAVTSIDDWVSAQTQGLFPTFLEPGDVTQDTRLVLVDAIYFKGTWTYGFDPSQTAMQPFTLSNGTVVQVSTMTGDVYAGVGQADGMQVVELPYKDGRLAMDLIVPAASKVESDAGSTLTTLEAGLTSSSLAAAIASLFPSEAELFLPKFSFTTRLLLVPVLETMGMTDVFEPGVANLSGMDGAADLYVKNVVQEAMVQVDESGTVAAAATGASDDCAMISSEPPVIAIDQPFLFLIRDTKSGSVLFMGHVDDPRQGS